jgi:hypothetical protein
MQVTMIGLDLAKQIIEGVAVLRRWLRRSDVVKFCSTLSGCLIGIESCATAHHWARELSRLGHQVKLIPPSYVKANTTRRDTTPISTSPHGGEGRPGNRRARSGSHVREPVSEFLVANW